MQCRIKCKGGKCRIKSGKKPILKKNLTIQKRGSSNLLEDITKSMVALRVDELVLTSKEALSISRICVNPLSASIAVI